MSTPPPFAPGTFTWIAGIEDTCVYPPAESGMNALDEYELTEHTENWRADFHTVADIGATSMRYGVNWPLVHTAPHTFDWTMLDERLQYAVQTQGLTVIADLVHYGVPTWIQHSFADPAYPDAIAEFAGAFAARYRGVVDHITPLNEPLTTASFCGLRGIWPPALTGWHGWTTVTLGIVKGMTRTIAAVRTANPDAVIVHVEASSLFEASEAAHDDHAHFLTMLGTLPTDLLLGLVIPGHPLHAWLLSHGATPSDLAELCSSPPQVDFMGVNYYPDLSPRTLVSAEGSALQVATNKWTDGLSESLRAFSNRYHRPMIITETSIEGDDATRSDWIDASTTRITELREEGLDIRGYTWWPVFDFVDWSYASGGRNVEEFSVDDDVLSARITPRGDDTGRSKTPFLRRMGLIRLEERRDGSLGRIRTVAAEKFAEIARSRNEAVVLDDAAV